MTEISGKAAFVTGGGSGIGMGLAKALAREGASVAVADILFDKASRVADEIVAAGGRAVPIHCDVCELTSIQEAHRTAKAALGPVRLVFANAGATSFDPLLEMSDADVRWIIEVNLMGVINTTRTFLPDMIAAGGGHVVATASMAGLLPGWIPLHSAYSAAKAGIIGLMMNVALELREHNVFTTTYCPGGVASGMKDNNSLYRPARFGGPAPEPLQIHEASAGAKQMDFYTPESVAPMVLRAVTKNRPFVFDHSDQRRLFRQTYVDVVEACYDDCEAYEREVGGLEVNPHGARLLRPA